MYSHSKKQRKFDSSKNAFTLYELIVVVLLIGIIAGIGASKVSLNNNAKFIINVDDFFSKILLTKQVALNFSTYSKTQKKWDNKAICVELNNNTLSSYLTILDNSGNLIGKKYITDENGNKIENISYSGISINSPYNVFCFDYEGRPFKENLSPENLITNDFNVTLTSGSNKKIITINGYTGNIFLN